MVAVAAMFVDERAALLDDDEHCLAILYNSIFVLFCFFLLLSIRNAQTKRIYRFNSYLVLHYLVLTARGTFVSYI
jgi:hypothetical protein